jgi:hypothetical protein
MDMSPKFRSEVIASVLNKTGVFGSSPVLRAIYGHKTTLNLSAIMNGNPTKGKRPKTLLCNLAKGRLAHLIQRMAGIRWRM